MPPDSVIKVGFIGSHASIGLADRLAGWAKVSVELHQLDAATDAARKSAAQLAARTDILITHFEDEEIATVVMLGLEGVLCSARAGLVVLELSPVSPGFIVELAARFEAAGSQVYGASLQGNQAYVDTALLEHRDVASLMQRIAPRIHSTGDVGTSKAMAIVERLLACVNATAAAEAVALGVRAGIPEKVLVPLLLKGSGGNQSLRSFEARAVRDEKFHEAGTLGSFQRDLALAVRLGRQHAHSVLFGALALAACRGAAGVSNDPKDACSGARRWLQDVDSSRMKHTVTVC